MVDATFRPLGSMRIALTASFLLMLAPAWGQVTVNSDGVTGDGRVLIDPGTGQTRVVPPLLQPWQFGTIKLHPPHARKAAAETTAVEPPPVDAPRHARKTAPATETAAVEPAVEAPAPPRQHRTAKPPAAPEKPRQTASVAPPPPAAASGFSGFGDLETLTAAPKPVEAAKPAPQKPVAAKPASTPVVTKPAAEHPAEPKPVQKASLEPAKPRGATGKARDSIIFSPNASDPSGSAVGAVRALAGSLANTLNDGSARIQLNAYAGQRGEKSSDTRRLALKRALVVRQLLIDDGIAAERIDVFALGGADDSGPLDRVDVLIKG